MAGRNGLFVPGPTNVPDRVLRSMVVPMEDHRSPKFPKLTLHCLEGLKAVFKTTMGTPFLFPASGTGSWDMQKFLIEMTHAGRGCRTAQKEAA